MVLRHWRIGKSFKVTSNSWEATETARAGTAGRGDADQHGVHPVPPDGHGAGRPVSREFWSLRVFARRRECSKLGRTLASCSTTFRRCSRASNAETEEEADQWLKDNDSARPKRAHEKRTKTR